MTKKMLNIVFIILGVVALYCTYQFYYVKNNEKIEEITTKAEVIQDDIDVLEAKIALEPGWKSSINEWTSDVDKCKKEFTSYVYDEDIVLYAIDVEDATKNLLITEIDIPDIEDYGYVECSAFALSMGTLTPTYTISSDYDNGKIAIDKIANDTDAKRAITSANLTYNNENGEMTSVIAYTEYLLNDGETTYSPGETETPKTGTDCIFGDIEKTEK